MFFLPSGLIKALLSPSSITASSSTRQFNYDQGEVLPVIAIGCRPVRPVDYFFFIIQAVNYGNTVIFMRPTGIDS